MTGLNSLDEWLAHLEVRHPVSIELGLERVGRVWERLGSPRPAPVCVTVAGTNGKGSTVAWLEAIARCQGIRTGTYTSPHLFRFTERVRIDGKEIEECAWVTALDKVESVRGDIGLSYFEHTTLAAFLMLAEASLDWAVLEVGLGGRLDAVNLIDADLAIITPIALDHQDWLGDTREKIAREKAGVLRSRQTVLISDRHPPAALLRIADELNTDLHRLGQCYQAISKDGENTVVIHDSTMSLPGQLPIFGGHQTDNLATALMAWVLLTGNKARDLNWTEVFRHFCLQGRLQRISRAPEVVVDVGHNAHAAESLLSTLNDGLGPWQVILGMLADKDAQSFVSALSPMTEHWFFCTLPGHRGRTAAELCEVAGLDADHENVSLHDTVEAGLEAARLTTAEGGRILVTGSFLTVAAAVEALQDSHESR